MCCGRYNSGVSEGHFGVGVLRLEQKAEMDFSENETQIYQPGQNGLHSTIHLKVQPCG